MGGVMKRGGEHDMGFWALPYPIMDLSNLPPLTATEGRE